MIIARQTAVPHYRFRNLRCRLSVPKPSVGAQAKVEEKSQSKLGCEGRRRWPGGTEQEEDCWRMSGHRVSWPGGADGHETNVIGEPSRLLPVARSAFLPLHPPPRPPASLYWRLRRCYIADSSSMIFQIRGNCPVASLKERRWRARHLRDGQRANREVARPELSLRGRNTV